MYQSTKIWLVLTATYLQIYTLLKVHIPPLTKLRQKMGSEDHMQKISRIAIAAFPQLSFFVMKKAKIMTSHQGIIVRLSMEETMIR